MRFSTSTVHQDALVPFSLIVWSTDHVHIRLSQRLPYSYSVSLDAFTSKHLSHIAYNINSLQINSFAHKCTPPSTVSAAWNCRYKYRGSCAMLAEILTHNGPRYVQRHGCGHQPNRTPTSPPPSPTFDFPSSQQDGRLSTILPPRDPATNTSVGCPRACSTQNASP